MQKLTPILPCHNRDGASESRPVDVAGELLAAWTALWHPALVAAAGTIPKWLPAGEPPDDPAGHLLLIPPTAEPLVPEDWWEHAQQLGARWIRGKRSRPEMIAAALATLESSPAIDADLVADFLALGYLHYAMETITVRIRFTNNIDESALEREAVAAAVAACGSDNEAARARLQAAFDLLHNAGEYYYACESYLLDLTLVAGSTLGEPLRAQLAGCTADAPCNVLLSGEVLEQMAAREPSTLEVLRQALQQGTASIIGGEYRELELPLLPMEAVREQLVQGISVYQHHLGMQPKIFARRRFGMTPLLPQILSSLNFAGVLHATLDDGRFPTKDASRQQWEGLDGTTVESLLRVPFDAAEAIGFVRLPYAVSGANFDSQPSAILAHWPGRTSCCYDDLRRLCRYTTALGVFHALPDYLEKTGTSAHRAAFLADDYRSPYLVQAASGGEPDPISRWQRYYTRRAATDAIDTIAALATMAGGQPSAMESAADDVLPTTADDFARAVGGVGARSTAFRRKTEDESRLKPVLQAPHGILVVNPLSSSRRICVDVDDLAALPDVSGIVLHAGDSRGRKAAVVEVPPLGFAVIRPGTGQAATSAVKRRFPFFHATPRLPPMAEQDAKQGGVTLRNEFFEVAIDSQQGAIRAVYDFHSRGPRIAQQIAMRLHGGDDDNAYSIMAADEVRAGPVVGEVAARGRLMSRDGQLLAEFRQTTRVTWGSRVIEVEVEIDPRRELLDDPWNSYYAARFAWAEDALKLYRGVNQATVASEAARFESPQFVEIRGASPRGDREGVTTILAAGLPYHRRCGPRRLDTLLIVRGETARRFRFGIGIGLPAPQAAALDFLAPSPVVPLATLPKNDSAWLYHLDNRAVVATHWEAIVEEGRVSGLRVRLLETEGRDVNLGLRSFRAIKSAQKAGGGERPPVDLTVVGDLVTVPLRPYEWAEVELR